MQRNFRTYQLAVRFYRIVMTLKLPRHLKEQLDRAASSVALNLAEGGGRASKADQRRFFVMAFASLRECQAILDLAAEETSPAAQSADVLAAHIYRLVLNTGG